MKHLGKFLRLPAADRQLLLEAALLLVAIRLGSKLLPFQTLRRLLAKVAKTLSGLGETDLSSTERIAGTVTVASRYIPGVSICLIQALTTQTMLARHGYPALLRIGVKHEEGRFQAHAWVESGGKVIIGGTELERYTPLLALGERT
jgi:hypothetical protein